MLLVKEDAHCALRSNQIRFEEHKRSPKENAEEQIERTTLFPGTDQNFADQTKKIAVERKSHMMIPPRTLPVGQKTSVCPKSLCAGAVLRRSHCRNGSLSEAVRDATTAQLVDVLAVEVEATRAGARPRHY
jgi:hypothetical protein